MKEVELETVHKKHRVDFARFVVEGSESQSLIYLDLAKD